MPKGKKYKLTQLDTLGVSLVKRGANLKRFAISKAAEAKMDVIHAVIQDETPFENQLDVESVLKQVSPKAQQGFKAMLRIANAFSDEMPKDMMDSLSKLAGFSPPVKKEAPIEKDPPVEKPELKATLDALPPELQEQVKGLWKTQEEALKKADEAVQESAKLREVIKHQHDETEKKELIQKARDSYGNIAMPAEELGALLKTVKDGSPEAFEAVQKAFDLAQKAVAESGLLTKQGVEPEPTVNTWSKIEAKAKGLVQKSSEPMAHAAAISLVLEQEPELYKAYIAESKGGN